MLGILFVLSIPAYYIVTKEEASGQLNMFNGYDELPQDEADLPEDDFEEDVE